jgi:hypothetical protein
MRADIPDRQLPVGRVLYLAQPDPAGSATEASLHQVPVRIISHVSHSTVHLTGQRG